jgi:CDP-glucose 4,6-dehydratase
MRKSTMENLVNMANPSHKSWQDRTAFVTGATGLVGSWLVPALLQRGARVVVLVRDHDPHSHLIRSGTIARTTVVNGKLEDIADLERAIAGHGVDTVFHLGAQTLVGPALRDPLGTMESNVRGTWNLLEACRRQAAQVKRVVIASSDKAYGDVPTLPYTEDTPLRGQHPYDVSKSCTDLVAQAWHHSYGTPVVIARCGNIYGGGDLNWSRIIPGTIRSLHRGERPGLRSDGTFLRDYVYVEDAVSAYIAMADALDCTPDGQPGGPIAGQAFNFGPGTPLSVLDVVAAITRLMGREDLPPIVRNEARAEIHDQYLDSTRATARLGWKPAWDLDAGLAPTIAWYRDYWGESG